MKTNTNTAPSGIKETRTRKLGVNLKNISPNPGKTRTDLYRNAFVQSADFMAIEAKSTYTRPVFHRKNSRIVFMAGNGKITISDYLRNMLTQHFHDFKEEINGAYNENLKAIL